MNGLKFRAWDGVKMLYPKDAYQDAGSGTFILLMDMSGKASWNNPYGFHAEKKAHVEIMLSSGLCDSNGNEIYRGDIVRTTWHSGIHGEDNISEDTEVTYVDGCFWEGDTLLKETHKDCEVIGNIYENSELINKGK